MKSFFGFKSSSEKLIEAAKSGDLKKVQSLVKKGADLGAKDKYGRTALMWAAWYGRESIVLYLVGAGADIDAKDEGGYTALMLAAWKDYGSTSRYLVGAGSDIAAKDGVFGKTALMWAARHGCESTARDLVGAGADIDAKDEDGNTALMLAARYGRKSTVRYLVSAGADIAAKANNGMTSLMLAARHGHESTARDLVGAGADIEAKDKNGRTALMLAKDKGHTKLAEYLEGAAVGEAANARSELDSEVKARAAADTVVSQAAAEPEAIPEVKARAAADTVVSQAAAEPEAIPEAIPEVSLEIQIDKKELSLMISSFGNLSKNMATRDELSAVGGIDANIIAWYQASYSFIQSVSELKDYYEASVGSLVASFSSLQMQDAGIAWEYNAGKEVYFGSFLSIIVNEVPIAKSVVNAVTKIAIEARSYSQEQYAKNLWSHIGKERNMSLYASMLACGMTLVFQESLKSGMPDKKNKLSDKVMKYCRSVFNEARGKMAQASVLSEFEDNPSANDGVSDALGLVRSMMCIEAKEGMQKDRLQQLLDIAKQIRDGRKSDSASYVADPFDITLVAGAMLADDSGTSAPMNVSPLYVNAPAAGGGGFVSSDEFASVEALEALRKERAKDQSKLAALRKESAKSAEEAAKSKARIAELEAKIPDQDGLYRYRKTQTVRQTNMLAIGAHGGVLAASNRADAESSLSDVIRVNEEMRSQIELLTARLALLEESQGKEAIAPNAGKSDQHKNNLKELFS